MEETLKEENPSPAIETIKNEESAIVNKKEKKELPEVSIVRNWKEYLGESLLIIFSVILALGLTEVINNLNEEKRTKEVLHQLREELIENKNAEQEQYAYHLQDSALNNPDIAKKFIIDGKIDIDIITPPPHGLLLHDLNDVAWQVAKQNNIFTKIDLSTYSLLTDIYNNQDRITKSEEEIAKVLLSWESRKPENLRTTLILVHNNYYAWDIQRAPRLLDLYQKAIDKLSKY